MHSTGIRSGAGDLTGGDDGLRQIVVDMGVDPRQRELNARYGGLLTAIEQDSPAVGCGLPVDPGLESGEVETRELYIELRQPCGVAESTGGDPRRHRLRYLQVQPVEPFQAVAIDARGVNGFETLD